MSLLPSQYQQTKSVIIDFLQRLANISRDVGMKTLASRIFHRRIPKVQDEMFHLVILGEFNHGKSTFVNALIGTDLLPVGITPTTAAINHVIYKDATRVRAKLTNGTWVNLAPDVLSEWVTAAGGQTENVAFVEIGYPSELLQANITLVDTPGVNDLNEQRAEVTYGYVPRADAVIFLLDASQALKDSERQFLASHILASTKERIIFVLGKIDQLSETEKKSVTQYVQQGLSQFVATPKVFPLSAKDWLDNNSNQSGMPEFLQYLENFLDTDRAFVMMTNGVKDALRTAHYIEQNLQVKLQSFDLDVSDLQVRVDKVRNQMSASKKELEALYSRIETEAQAIKNQTHLDLDTFAKEFASIVPTQIDSIDSSELKSYLPAFLQDKFKEWAEKEGQKVGMLMQGLAEDVIAITNANVSKTAEFVSAHIGPENSALEIDVDSFKYDMGVYALGALGTTVLLFVNGLAGGLLTLAAPILAIVVRSKMAGDMREQAKQRAPSVIHKAAESMRPHFDTCIDDFASRLRDFVASAGNTLYEGISEILDQSIAERTKIEKNIEPLISATQSSLQETKHIAASLEKILRTMEQRSAA